MPTAPLTGDRAAQTVDEQFYDLICADADLVAAEFEAIIAAEWPEPPARRPRRRDAGGGRGRGRARRAATGSPRLGPPRDGDVDRSARERGPPPGSRRPTDNHREPPRTTENQRDPTKTDDDREGR